MAAMRRPGLISCGEAAARLRAGGRIRFLDASYQLGGTGSPSAAYRKQRIQGARFFDLDGAFSDKSTSLPHMLPPAAQFSRGIRRLGVAPGDMVVAYEEKSLFSSPRCWWMFRAYGWPAADVAVLDGGLHEFKESFPDLVDDRQMTEENMEEEAAKCEATVEPFDAAVQEDMVRSLEQIQENLASHKEVVVDARSQGRFSGKDPEPRPTLRSGHMPNSKNASFDLLQDEHGKLHQPQKLKDFFMVAGVPLDGTPLVTSCGSGVTAAVVSLALETCGVTSHALFDGSWTQYADPGHEAERPIVKKEQ